MVKKQEFNGKSLSDALQEAASAFQTDVGAIAYSVVEEEKTNSFFSRLFTKGITIEAWVEDGGNIEEAARAAAMEAIEDHYEESRPPQQIDSPKKNSRFSQQDGPTPKLKTVGSAVKQPEEEGEVVEEEVPRNFTPLDAPEVEEIITKLIKLILRGMEIEENAFQITPLQDNYRIVQVDDEFLEQWLTRSDRLSECFEHLFRRILQKSGIEVSGRLFLDARDARELRTEKLKGLAFHLADKVKNTGRTVGISSKTSQERRIIHLALDGTPGIGTRSIGTGDNRKLIIFNTERNRQRSNNRGGHSGGRQYGGGRHGRRHNRSQGGRFDNRNQAHSGDDAQPKESRESFFNGQAPEEGTQESKAPAEGSNSQQPPQQGNGRKGVRPNRRPPFHGRGGRGGHSNYQGGGRKGAFSGGKRDNNATNPNSSGETNAARSLGADGDTKQDRRSRRNPHRQRNSSEVEQSES